jgi:hypothetical protein
MKVLKKKKGGHNMPPPPALTFFQKNFSFVFKRLRRRPKKKLPKAAEF